MEQQKEFNLRNHFYEAKRVRQISFYKPASLGFLNSIAADCDFVEPTNLIFHNTLLFGCIFSGILNNVVFDGCRLRRCSFAKAVLKHVSFRGKIKIQDTVGLPGETPREQEGICYSRRGI